MMPGYGRAVVEDRLTPQRFAEIAAFVRSEYGRGIGPGFLVANALNGAAARKPRRRTQGSFTRGLRALAHAIRSLVAGGRTVREEKASNPTR